MPVPGSAGFRPAEEILGGYSFDVTTARKQSFDKSSLIGSWTPGKITIGGRLSSDDLPGFDRPWTIDSIDSTLTYDAEKRIYSLAAKIRDMEGPVNPRRRLFAVDSSVLYEKFPVMKGLQTFFERYGPSGRVDINVEAAGRY